MEAYHEFPILNSSRKMMTYFIRDMNKILRYCTLFTSILKCGYPTKGIKVTWFILFEVLEVCLSFEVTDKDYFSRYHTKI